MLIADYSFGRRWLTPRARHARQDGKELSDGDCADGALPALPPEAGGACGGAPWAAWASCEPEPQPPAEPPSPMAHIVKWCKARFFSGYRQFSGE